MQAKNCVLLHFLDEFGISNGLIMLLILEG